MRQILWPGRLMFCVFLLVAAGCAEGVLTGGGTHEEAPDGAAPPSADALRLPTPDSGQGSNVPLAAPADLLGLHVAGGYKLSWSDTNDHEEGYLVERAPAKGSPFQQVAQLGVGASGYTDTNFPATGRPIYRVRATAGGQPGPAATCDSGVKAWTYIRIVGYDALWGSKGPTMDSLKSGHLDYDLVGVADRKNINLVLFGDSYGANGSIYAFVGESGAVVENRPEANTGDPETYRQLFDWVLQNHPGQRYALSYWSHGSGWSIGLDETNNDQLTTEELASVLEYLTSRAGRQVEVVFVCACLQQMLKNAYAVRKSVRYVVAGESSVGCGCDVLSVLKDNLTRDAGWLASANTDCQTMEDWPKDVVYSAVKTDETEQLAALLDQLAVGLKSYAERGPAEANKLRSLAGQVQHMGLTAGDQFSAHLDLVDLCQRLPQLGDPVITQRAQQVAAATKDNVVTRYVIQNDAKGLYGKARGLAIFHPNPNSPYYFQSFGATALARDTRWDEYLQALYP